MAKSEVMADVKEPEVQPVVVKAQEVQAMSEEWQNEQKLVITLETEAQYKDQRLLKIEADFTAQKMLADGL